MDTFPSLVQLVKTDQNSGNSDIGDRKTNEYSVGETVKQKVTTNGRRYSVLPYGVYQINTLSNPEKVPAHFTC